MIRIEVLKKGDKVLSVTSEFIAVQRKNGEVDLLPMVKDEMGLRIDIEHIITIVNLAPVFFMPQKPYKHWI